jgi:peptidoglycan hydrolase-like protein with peptidoglycan-binding domain
VRRRTAVVAGAGLAVILGGGALLAAIPAAQPGGARAATAPPTTAAIARRTRHATTQVEGTLGYDGDVAVANALATAGADGAAAADQGYAGAQAQHDQAVAALAALRHPSAADLGPLKTQVAQASASVTQAAGALRVDLAGARAAKRSLAACKAASSADPPCDVVAARLGVKRAQATGDADRAQLAAAEAGRSSASASLHARQHPTAAQVRQARHAVAAARSALEAARVARDRPSGVLTAIADVGSIVEPGDALYTVDGSYPVILLQGDVPAWRDLGPGVTDGVDVRQLETNLVALGFADATLEPDEHWDGATTAAVEAWQASLGLPGTGRVPLGSVVFAPSALRITGHTATPGTALQPGTPVLAATSPDRVVTVALDPSLQTKVSMGDQVSVVLPDGSTTPGTVSDVGTVATAPSGNGDPSGNGSQTPTIDVTVTLADPSAAGTLDQAPVTLDITTATAEDVLAVPVNALLELLEGGYAVQVEDAGQLRYVPVTLGLFADGWVEVSGPGLDAGQHVVVAQ